MSLRTGLAGAAVIALAGLVAWFRSEAPERLVWWEGVAVRWRGGQGVVLSPGGELLVTRRTRVVPWPIVPAGRPLLEAAPVSGGGVWLVDGAGTVLRLDDDLSLDSVGRAGFDIPTVAAGPQGIWVARSAVQFTFRPESAAAPLVRLFDNTLAAPREMGSAAIPDNPFLTQLANAARILALEDGGVVVAPFVRDLVIRFDAAGREVWRTRRGLTHETPNPGMLLREEGGRQRVLADYAPVNLGLAEGPDGTVYVLSTVGARTDSSRLDALDPATGALRRTWRYGTALPTLIADRQGEVRLADPAGLRAGVATPEDRAPFPPFALPGPTGDTVRLADLEGKVVLVNFWASWCGPCREEMPSLDSLAGTLDSSRLRFVALSDDISSDAAQRFLVENPVSHLAVGLGAGRLKGRYHYLGLPTTMLLDGQGRIIYRWVGYTGPGQIAAIGAAVDAALDEAAAAATPHHHPPPPR